MTALLKIDNLTCVRSNNLLFSNLSFEVERGKTVEIIGPNGSGKTSLLRCILGLIEKDEGTIYWKGESMQKCKDSFLKSCFYQGHKLALKSSFTVLENLKYSNSAIRMNEEQIIKTLKKVNLADLAFRPSSDLSIGQLKKIAIARWLLKEQEIYLIDEPFTALDEEGANLIKKIVVDLNSKGVSFLITGHRASSLNSEEIYLDV